MRRYHIAPRILLILIVITFALAVPVLVQEKRQAPEDVMTVLGKRTLEEDLATLWEGRWHYRNVLKGSTPPLRPPRPELAEVQMPEVNVPSQGPAGSGRESMVLVDNAPPGMPPSSLGSSTELDAPSVGSQSEDPKAADSDLKDIMKVLRRISDTASGVDMVNAAQMELRSVDPGL
jgi:hypothetical protein